jgi:hypothetical protein
LRAKITRDPRSRPAGKFATWVPRGKPSLLRHDIVYLNSIIQQAALCAKPHMMDFFCPGMRAFFWSGRADFGGHIPAWIRVDKVSYS